MEKRTGLQIPPERLERFLIAYVEYGCNALKAAIAIGMKPNTARANACRYVQAIRARDDFRKMLDDVGLDSAYILLKLRQLIDAKMPKWNPSKKRWDTFEDWGTQMEAVREVCKLRDLYPAEKPAVEPVTVNLILDREP